ncbi:hypothetical protein GALMADRAFT_875924 [Galerina marginata CBS 339.88]|uniref:Uncharacterized protein n=1 Tax=Galerina marginata (strain CBS 339.88) TaxID=685588 RepID=A0A067TTI4_GALM3|nr:hypothetical protein GALMADRAFT_875924 [Galerina marginata CBS 339.88]
MGLDTTPDAFATTRIHRVINNSSLAILAFAEPSHSCPSPTALRSCHATSHSSPHPQPREANVTKSTRLATEAIREQRRDEGRRSREQV